MSASAAANTAGGYASAPRAVRRVSQPRRRLLVATCLKKLVDAGDGVDDGADTCTSLMWARRNGMAPAVGARRGVLAGGRWWGVVVEASKSGGEGVGLGGGGRGRERLGGGQCTATSDDAPSRNDRLPTADGVDVAATPVHECRRRCGGLLCTTREQRRCPRRFVRPSGALRKNPQQWVQYPRKGAGPPLNANHWRLSTREGVSAHSLYDSPRLLHAQSHLCCLHLRKPPPLLPCSLRPRPPLTHPTVPVRGRGGG